MTQREAIFGALSAVGLLMLCIIITAVARPSHLSRNVRGPWFLSGGSGNEAVSGVARRAAVLEIGSLQLGDPVPLHRREFGAQIEPVKARRVVTEDRALDGAVGGSEGSKTPLLLHVLRDFEPAERLDLPLRRTVPHRVGAPEHVIMPEPFDQGAHHCG